MGLGDWLNSGAEWMGWKSEKKSPEPAPLPVTPPMRDIMKLSLDEFTSEELEECRQHRTYENALHGRFTLTDAVTPHPSFIPHQGYHGRNAVYMDEHYTDFLAAITRRNVFHVFDAALEVCFEDDVVDTHIQLHGDLPTSSFPPYQRTNIDTCVLREAFEQRSHTITHDGYSSISVTGRGNKVMLFREKWLFISATCRNEIHKMLSDFSLKRYMQIPDIRSASSLKYHASPEARQNIQSLILEIGAANTGADDGEEWKAA